MQFTTETELLAWACNLMQTGIGAASSLRPRTGSGSGLAPHEQRALAAQVMSWISTLPMPLRTVILARYGVIDPATAGYALSGEVPNTYGVTGAAAAVRWYCSGGTLNQRWVGDQIGRSQQTASRYTIAVAEVLDGLNRQACEQVRQRYGDLLRGGLDRAA